MIPPGLLVAVTLASAHSASADARLGAGTGAPAGGAPPNATESADRVSRVRAGPSRADEAAPNVAGFPELLLAMVMGATPTPPSAPTPAVDAPPSGAVDVDADTELDGGALGGAWNAHGHSAWMTKAADAPALAMTGFAPLPTAVAVESTGEVESPAPMVVSDDAALVASAPAPDLAAGLSRDVAAVPAPDAAEQVVVAPQVPPAAIDPSASLDPTTLRGLDRDFVSRLNRVAQRMWSEHGRRVEVVEGVRSQLRQNELFTQGRSEPGPVVTWTTQSLHTVGQAADLYVDGGPVTPDAALLLARIAREEGLQTLYPIDSGHIQVDGPGSDMGPESLLPRRPEAPAVGVAAPRKGVAPVAPVAPVAKPARVDGVGALDDAPTRHDPTPSPASETAQGPLADRLALSATTVSPTDAAAQNVPGSSPTDPGARVALLAARPSHAEPSSPSPAAASAPPMDPARFETPEAPSPFRSVHVPLDALGEGASLLVGVRGSIVDAHLRVGDPLLAADLTAGLRDLGQQLARRGLEAGELAVRMIADAPMEGPRPTSAAVPVVDLRGLQAGGGSGASSSDAGSQQGRTSGSSYEAPEGRDRGSRQRKETPQERSS
ncbi:MAG: hypothetical protein ABL963_09095 [Longimicrobiales bacterium]